MFKAAVISAVLGAALIAAVLASGCGSSDDQTSTATTVTVSSSLTKATFRRQANVICNKGKAEYSLALVRMAEEKGGKEAAEVPLDTQREVVLKSLRKQIDEIRELGSPPGDEAKVEAFLDAFQNSTDEMEEKELEGVEEIQPVLVHIYKPALAYGLKGCAYGH